jgi:hypothetical protein
MSPFSPLHRGAGDQEVVEDRLAATRPRVLVVDGQLPRMAVWQVAIRRQIAVVTAVAITGDEFVL